MVNKQSKLNQVELNADKSPRSAKDIVINHTSDTAKVAQEVQETKVAAIDSQVPLETADSKGTDSTHIAASEYSPREMGIWQVEKPAVIAEIDVFNDQFNVAHFGVMMEEGRVAVPVRSSFGKDIIRAQAKKRSIRLKQSELTEYLEDIQAYANQKGINTPVFERVAPITDGIEIDGYLRRVRIIKNRVEINAAHLDTLFRKSPIATNLPIPGDTGDHRLLLKHLSNVSTSDALLILTFITYTIATPKTSDARYVFLVINGDQGTGKSTLTKMIVNLIDPSISPIKSIPKSQKDLAVVLSNAHVVAFDNMRNFNANMSDALCKASTGASIEERALYTNNGIATTYLHGAIIFNGIHSIQNHPDFTERCLTIYTKNISRETRKDDREIEAEFEADIPQILRGLYELIAKIFDNLDKVPKHYPERMTAFCKWLSAMELALDMPKDELLSRYSKSLRDSKLDSLMENLLAATLVKFAETQPEGKWSGTPAKLLEALEETIDPRTRYSREWPANPISLGKKIHALKASLAEQGIQVIQTRGKKRLINITAEDYSAPCEDFDDDSY